MEPTIEQLEKESETAWQEYLFADEAAKAAASKWSDANARFIAGQTAQRQARMREQIRAELLSEMKSQPLPSKL